MVKEQAMKPLDYRVEPPLVAHKMPSVRVTYCDTDRMGYAYHSQYLVWFEMGRTELLRSLGTTYKSWEDEEGIFLPVRSAEVQYRTPAKYDDLLVVQTDMVKLTRASVVFYYRISREGTEELLATGSTTHAFVNAEGKVCRAAERLLPQFF